jgi:hypothetical protein
MTLLAVTFRNNLRPVSILDRVLRKEPDGGLVGRTAEMQVGASLPFGLLQQLPKPAGAEWNLACLPRASAIGILRYKRVGARRTPPRRWR